VDDVYEFLRLWEKVAEAREESLPRPAALVARIKKERVSILHLSTSNLRIDGRAAVTLNNPLIQLEFENIYIAGDLIARGELVLKCDTLTMA